MYLLYEVLGANHAVRSREQVTRIHIPRHPAQDVLTSEQSVPVVTTLVVHSFIHSLSEFRYWSSVKPRPKIRRIK
jgi:hypothetical protein